MKNFFFCFVLVFASLDISAAQTRLGPISVTTLGGGNITTTNAPLPGAQLFTDGTIFYWGYGTNTANTNATVIIASPSIGVTTNAFNSYTPFFSATATNWIYQLMLQGTNQSLLIGSNDTNNDNQVRIDETNNVNKVISLLVLTNVVVIQGTNGITVITNVVAGVSQYTVHYTGISTLIPTNGISLTTNANANGLFVVVGANLAPGTSITFTTNAAGQITINSTGGIGGTNAVLAGVDIFINTNGVQYTVNFNTSPTNIASITGTNGASIVFGGSPSSIAWQLVRTDGTVLFNIDTNGIIQTNIMIGSGMSFQRIVYGITNGFPGAINVLDFGLKTNGDMSVIFQNAINYATNTFGDIVNLPAGVFLVTNLVVPQGVVLRGHSSPFNGLVSVPTLGGETGTTLYSGSYGGPVIRLQGGGQLIENIGLYSAGGGIAIQSDTNAPGTVCQYATIQNCRIYGYNIGINGYYFENSWLLNNYITCQTNIYFTNAANANWVIGGHLGGGIYGVRIEGGTGAVCDGNHIFTSVESCSNGVSIVGTSVQSTEIDPTDMESNTNDITVNGASGTKIIGGHFDKTIGGTNLVAVGAKGLSFAPDWVYDGSRAFNIDSTSFGISIDLPKVGINPTSFSLLSAAQTGKYWDGTNLFIINGKLGASNFYSPTNTATSGFVLQATSTSGDSAWTAVQGVTIPNTITPTNFVVNTRYTNSSGSIQLVDATVALITASVAGVAAMDLMADQAGGTAFVLQDRVAISTLITGLTVNYTNNLSGALSNNATYYFTNTSSGAGNSSAIVPSTGELVTLSDGGAAGVATLSGNNAFTGNNTFGGSTIAQLISQATNGGFSLNQVARSNIVDQIQTWPTSTNQLIAIPGSTSWLIQSATPTAQTNISGTLSATQWIFQSLVVSNNTAAAFTNWITIPAAKAVGYAATNDVAVLGGNMTVIPASSYKEILFKVRLGQTNWAVINP